MADFDDQFGAPLGREKQRHLISPIFPSGMRLRRIHGDLSLAIPHGFSSVFLSCVESVINCWLFEIEKAITNKNCIEKITQKIANCTLRVLAPNNRASVPSAQAFAISIPNIRELL